MDVSVVSRSCRSSIFHMDLRNFLYRTTVRVVATGKAAHVDKTRRAAIKIEGTQHRISVQPKQTGTPHRKYCYNKTDRVNHEKQDIAKYIYIYI